MAIYMIGIDHSNASIEYRETFSLTQEEQIEAMLSIKSRQGVEGCIIISTCNRMEIWISADDSFTENLYEILCDYKGVDIALHKNYFAERSDTEAVEHLLYLSSGLKSRVIGEDQILAQVKASLTLSREQACTDKVLEVLFHTAITAGKKVKTHLIQPRANVSVVKYSIQKLKESGIEIKGKTCMVIGNGIMGKEMASCLYEEGAEVTVTVRQSNNHTVNIPEGCKCVYYGQHMEHFAKCHIVVSATTSPNYTLERSFVEQAVYAKNMILIDLAVPRDIEPSISDLSGITLYNIDDFETKEGLKALQEYKEAAITIIADELKRFSSWYECRDLFVNIHSITHMASSDIIGRIGRTLKGLPLENRSLLEAAIQTATNKVLIKLLFGLRSQVDTDIFRQCIEGLVMVYDKEEDLV